MNKFLYLFVCVIIFVLLFTGCTSTSDVYEYSDILISKSDDTFYIRNGGSSSVGSLLLSEFKNSGLNAIMVYDISGIPEEEVLESQGSGFFIAPDLVVTNSHVLTDESNIAFYLNGTKIQADVLVNDKTNDIAILKSPVKSDVYFQLKDINEINVADSIFVLGFPMANVLGNGVKITNGIINSLTGLGDDSTYLQISAQIQPGNSGGPVVTNDFKVVGVATSKLSDSFMVATTNQIAQNVNYAIKTDIIKLLSNGLSTEVSGKIVSTFDEASSATVQIESGNQDAYSTGKRYYVDFDISYYYRGYYSFPQLNMQIYDIDERKVVAECHTSGDGLSTVDMLVPSAVSSLLEKIGAE